MRRGRYQKSDTTRERILDAAAVLFSQRGYAATGVDRLAERSGIAKTAIYYHFGNKEGLLAAVVERAAAAWMDNIRESASRGGDPAERLDRALTGMRAMVEEKPWILKLLLLLTLEVADAKPEIRSTMQNIFVRARDTIISGLNEAMDTEVPDAEEIAVVLLAMLQGIVIGRQIDPDLALEQAFRRIREVTTYLVVSRLDRSHAVGVDVAGEPDAASGSWNKMG
jgi:AcrR family transcriptional regulator